MLAMRRLSSSPSPYAFLEQVCSSGSAAAVVLPCSEASSCVLSSLGEELPITKHPLALYGPLGLRRRGTAMAWTCSGLPDLG